MSYKFFNSLTPKGQLVFVVILMLILISSITYLAYERYMENQILSKIQKEQEREELLQKEKERLMKEEEKNRREQRRQEFLQMEEFLQLGDIIFQEERLPKRIEFIQYGLCIQHNEYRDLKLLRWEELVIPVIKSEDLMLANEALYRICNAREENRYNLHSLAGYAEIVLL